MNWKVLACSIAIIFGGCPKRHTGPQIVYIPTPPPAASPSQSTQALVIQTPTPSVPVKVAPEPASPTAKLKPVRHRHFYHKRPQVKVPPQVPANVPALQSGLSSSRETQLRNQVVNLQQGIEKQIARLSQEQLTQSQQNTLEGARGFLHQSERALQQSDLQRASNLAHKADLLIMSLDNSQ